MIGAQLSWAFETLINTVIKYYSHNYIHDSDNSKT